MLELCLKKSFSNSANLNYNISTDKNRIVLFGPSGSGKSSLLKMIAGFLTPDKGIIKINNRIFFQHNRKKLPIYKRKVGYLPQDYTLFPHMTIKDNILYSAKIKKIKINKKFYLHILDKLELKEKLKFYPHQLSGGEKQRVALARALMSNPDILLLDEPFSSLDKTIKENLRDTVLEIVEETGTKAIFVTHDFDDAYILGKEVYVVLNGQVIEKGPADKIFNSPTYIETARLVGFKNIFIKEEAEKIFGCSLTDEYIYFGIKNENIQLFNNFKKTEPFFSSTGIIKKITNKTNLLELKLNVKNKALNVFIPKFQKINKFYINSKVEIFILKEHLIPFKTFYS